MDQKPPPGQLFTHVYQDRGAPNSDNHEFRQRLTAYLVTNAYNDKAALGNYIARETGYIRPYETSPYDLFKTLPIERALNLITVVWRYFYAQDRTVARQFPVSASGRAASWKSFVERALKEENVGYSVDEQCGVHYLVDDEFEHNRNTTVRALNLPKYSAVLSAFNSAHNYLDPNALDTKAAVRCMFEALEIQTKLMVKTQNLNRYCAEKLLKDVALKAIGSDAVAEKVIEAVFASFGVWVDGLHMYRHGQGTVAPIAPPIELAVYILSSGAAYLRLLIDVDQRSPFTP